MATTFRATNQVLDVIAGQLREQLDDDVDEVRLFDGLLSDAIEFHMTKAKNSKVFLFVGLPGDEPESTSGDGMRLRSSIAIDIHVVIRSGGKTRYEDDIYTLMDVSDAVVFTAFEHSNRSSQFIEHISTMTDITRTRQNVAASTGVLAHQVRFTCIPMR